MFKPIQGHMWKLSGFFAVTLLFSLVGVRAQDTQTPDAALSTPPGGGRQHRQGQDDNGPRPVLGRIAAIQDGSIRITRPDGSEQTIKITAQTQFRRDREPAKLKDFKVGDGILVRGEENPDYSITASMIAGRGGNGGPNGGPNRQNPVGTLGKDFVVGEVKAIDPPGITVMRTDNVKQSFELNEDTSLRKGRDSVTMADIQVGDHIFARGELQQNQFVPKSVSVIEPEQWKRMQEMGLTTPGAGRATQQGQQRGQQNSQQQGGGQGNGQGDAQAGAQSAAPSGAPSTEPSKPSEPPN
jgi:hypothetical protein